MKKTMVLVGLLLTLVGATALVNAAPMVGQVINETQPNGKIVKVKVFGDEFYRRMESMDGYTLVKDSETGYICYAKINKDGTDFESTKIVYKDSEIVTMNSSVSDEKSVLTKGLKLDSSVIRGKVTKLRNEMNSKINKPVSSKILPLPIAPAGTNPVNGNVIGLTLLIDFPDRKATIGQAKMNNFFNQNGYKEFGNNGSVKDYFSDISGGALQYSNVVPNYYRAKHNKSYYDGLGFGTGAVELIKEALDSLRVKGFNFNQLSKNSFGEVMALNVFYAGDIDSGWSEGLWPHAWYVGYTVNGVTFGNYQISNIGSAPAIGVVCHENGHMLMGWEDTYDYDFDSQGAGWFDLMALACYNNNGYNPGLPNPYFRNVISGWGKTSELTPARADSRIAVPSETINSIIYKTKNKSEYFMIENIQNIGRWKDYLGNGLLIWHIDENGNNNYQDMTANKHYVVSVEQADGNFELEKNIASGGQEDFFYGGYKNSFTTTTNPSSKLWSGVASGLSITRISKSAKTMAFDFNKINAYPVPGKLEAEKFIRRVGLTNQKCSEGTLNITSTDAGDWAEYRVNVKTAGTYFVRFRVASAVDGSRLQMLDSTGKILATRVLPNTGGNQTWKTVSSKITLEKGVQVIKLRVINGGFNLNWMNFVQ